MSKQEKRRIERLKKELDNQQRKLDEDKKKFHAQKKAQKEEKAHLEREKKQLQQKIRRFQLSQSASTRNMMTPRPTTPRGTPIREGELKKVKADLSDTKKQLDESKASVRELRKSIADRDAEIKRLQRDLKKAGRGGKGKGNNDREIKQLKREIANLKKRLKIALRDLDKQARYYQQQLKRFKQDQQKWINRQRDTHKNKGLVVKYVFIDDIRKIKVYKKRKNRIKIRTRDGGEVIVHDVQIVEASEIEEAADDIVDEVTQELEKEFKKKRRKKKKNASGSGDEDDDEKEDDEDGDDEGEEEEDEEESDHEHDDEEEIEIEDHTDDIYHELLEELTDRTKDLHRMNEIYTNDDDDDTQDSQFKELWESVIGRHKSWTTKLSDEYNFDLADELPDINQQWQDEIYKVKDSVVQIRRRARKKGKKEGVEEGQQAAAFQASQQDDAVAAKMRDEVQYLIAAKDQMIHELNGRISDLQALNTIYFHPEQNAAILSKEQQVEELVNNVEGRHEHLFQELSDLPPSENNIDALLPENNHQWKEIIYAMGREMEQNDATPLRQELESRTKDLEKGVQVISGNEPMSALEEVITGIHERNQREKEEAAKMEKEASAAQQKEMKDREEWLSMMEALQTANAELQDQLAHHKALAEAAQEMAKAEADKPDLGPVAKAQKLLIEGLMQEMNNRRNDLNALSSINALELGSSVGSPVSDEAMRESMIGDLPSMQPMNSTVAAQGLRQSTIKRHQRKKTQLAASVRPLVAAAKLSHGNDGDKEIQDALKLIEEDNKKWQEQMQKLVSETKNIEDLKQRNKAAMLELDGRIADVLKMKDLYTQANDESVGSGERQKKASEYFDSLRSAIKDRHEGNEQAMMEVVNDDEMEEMEENDNDWRDAVFNTASHVAGLVDPKPLSPEPETPQLDYEEAKEEAVEFPETMPPKVAIYDEEEKEWWLDKNAKRRAHIDSIAVDEEQKGQLLEIAAYCDRVLYRPNTDKMLAATDLYFPIPEQDDHHILSTFYDGCMILDLVAYMDPDYVDLRTINFPDPFDPTPLDDKLVIENVSLLLSASRSIGVEMTSYDVEDWMDPSKHTAMLIELVNGLSEMFLDKKFDLKRHPELCRLIQDGEDALAVENMSGSEWLSRWMNHVQGKGLKSNIGDGEWAGSTYETMKKASPVFANSAPCDSFGDDANKAAMSMITHITNKVDTGTTVRPSDLSNGDFHKVHKFFASEAYSCKSGLAPLSDSERGKYKEYLTSEKTTEEDTFISWINAMVPAHLHIEILTRDLSDGVVLLKLMEKGKAKCVNWKRAKEKVKHKFDKLNNCNMVMALANKAPFNFSLVGMGGNDIVDGNQMFLASFLWQLMRFMAVKTISELSFGGKNVTDADMLQWANVTIEQFEEKRSRKLGSFKDQKLSTCIFYIELLAAIRPNDVDTTLINYDVRPLVNNRVKDSTPKERLANARLAMSYVRKFGADLFVLPEHLCGMEPKAVLSMFAGIMTVGMKDSAYSGDGVVGDSSIDKAAMGHI